MSMYKFLLIFWSIVDVALIFTSQYSAASIVTLLLVGSMIIGGKNA